jgi:acetyl-CoA carboxylase carboxyl transferase subunit beta
VIGFAGARVIEETIREQLPEGFQRAEYLRDHGMVDRVVHRHSLRDEIVHITDLLMNRGAPAARVVPMNRVARAVRTQPARDEDAADDEQRPAAE